MDKIYYAYYHQDRGCDYTIACGTAFYKLNATNMDDAIKETEQYIKENFRGDSEIVDARVIESSKIYSIDVIGVYNEVQQEITKQKEEETRIKELAILEKLKQKYEK
jgi:hypothetical protein